MFTFFVYNNNIAMQIIFILRITGGIVLYSLHCRHKKKGRYTMAKQELSQSVVELIDKEIKNISAIQRKSDGLALKISACIARMADTNKESGAELDKIVIDRLRDEVGISKATAYSSLQVARRYGNPTTYEIEGDYAKWSFRALLECKEMSDAEISELGFNSKTMIKDIVSYKRGLKAAEKNKEVEEASKDDISTTATDITEETGENVSRETYEETGENVSRETYEDTVISALETLSNFIDEVCANDDISIFFEDKFAPYVLGYFKEN